MKLKQLAVWTLIFACAAFLVKNPVAGADNVKASLQMCAACIFPALFPFTVIINLAVSSGFAQWAGQIASAPTRFLFGLNGTCGCAVLLGMTAGFPCGAKFAAKLYSEGLCTADEAQRAAGCANNAGAAFVIGAVGCGMFGDISIGVKLYAAQIIAACIVGIITGLTHHKKIKSNTKLENMEIEYTISPAILGNAVSDAVTSVLTVCGFICFFGVINVFLSCILTAAGIPSSICSLLCGILEFAGGMKSASDIGGMTGAVLCALYLGWSGICVHMQTAAILGKYGLKSSPYAAAKALQCILCAILMYVLMKYS